MTNISITGHADIERCIFKKPKQEGQIYDKEAYDEVYKNIEKVINKLFPDKDITLISGMARGADEIFAKFAINNNLPLILSIPGSVKWHKDRGLSRGIRAQAIDYEDILKYKNIVKIYEVNKNYNGKMYDYVNFARNQQMVDISDKVLSYRIYQSSGTDNGIKVATEAKKYIGNIPDIAKRLSIKL